MAPDDNNCVTVSYGTVDTWIAQRTRRPVVAWANWTGKDNFVLARILFWIACMIYAVDQGLQFATATGIPWWPIIFTPVWIWVMFKQWTNIAQAQRFAAGLEGADGVIKLNLDDVAVLRWICRDRLLWALLGLWSAVLTPFGGLSLFGVGVSVSSAAYYAALHFKAGGHRSLVKRAKEAFARLGDRVGQLWPQPVPVPVRV